MLPAAATAAPVPLPPLGWTVEVNEEATMNAQAYAYADILADKVITSGPLDRYQLAHEVGHLFDWQVLTDSQREEVRLLMHAPAGDWEREHGAGEWFADYYAAAAITPIVKRRTSRGGNPYAYATVTTKRLVRFRRYLNRVGLDEHLATGLVGSYVPGVSSHDGL